MFSNTDIQCVECGNIIDLEDDGVIQSNEVVWCPICGRAQNANPDGFYLDGFSIDSYEEVDESWTMNYLSDDLNGKWGADNYEAARDEFDEFEKYLQGEIEESPVHYHTIRSRMLESDRGNRKKRSSEISSKRRSKRTAYCDTKNNRNVSTKRIGNRRVGVTDESIPDVITKAPNRPYVPKSADKD